MQNVRTYHRMRRDVALYQKHLRRAMDVSSMSLFVTRSASYQVARNWKGLLGGVWIGDASESRIQSGKL